MTNLSSIYPSSGSLPAQRNPAASAASGAPTSTASAFSAVLAALEGAAKPATATPTSPAAPGATTPTTTASPWDKWGHLDPPTGHYVDNVTGRHAYYGPDGEPGTAWAPDQPIPTGMAVVRQPDGSWAAFKPGDFAYADTSRAANNSVLPVPTTTAAALTPPKTGDPSPAGWGSTYQPPQAGSGIDTTKLIPGLTATYGAASGGLFPSPPTDPASGYVAVSATNQIPAVGEIDSFLASDGNVYYRVVNRSPQGVTYSH